MNPILKAQLEVMALGDQSWKLFVNYHHLDWYLVSNGWEKVLLRIGRYTYLKNDTNLFLAHNTRAKAYETQLENIVWLLAKEKELTACEFTKDLVEGYIAANGDSGFEGP